MINSRLKERYLLPLASFLLMTALGVLLLLMAEAWAMLSLPKDTRFSFLLNENFNKSSVTIPYHHIDPLLGYTFPTSYSDNERKNLKFHHQYIVYGNEEAPLRIMLLGGSSTDGVFYPKNWGLPLQALLKEEGLESVIYNGAVAGYTSTQELLKLIRDIKMLRPNIVISYNGVNEFEYHSTQHSFYHKKQLENIRKLQGEISSKFFPNLVYWLSKRFNKAKLSLGLGAKQEPHKRFKENLLMMRAITRANSGDFIHFLQPTLKALIDNPPQPYQNKNGLRDVIKRQNLEIPILRERTKDLTFSHDFSNLLDFRPQYFLDNCHVIEEGNKYIAKQIFEILKKDKLLQKK